MDRVLLSPWTSGLRVEGYTMSQDVEPDMAMESREGASSDLEVKIGTERWFAEAVGLPNWGINPLTDLFHVRMESYFRERYLTKATRSLNASQTK